MDGITRVKIYIKYIKINTCCCAICAHFVNSFLIIIRFTNTGYDLTITFNMILTTLCKKPLKKYNKVFKEFIFKYIVHKMHEIKKIETFI